MFVGIVTNFLFTPFYKLFFIHRLCSLLNFKHNKSTYSLI
nr:MAG TPA: hypothetical protein [Caudoviricetes sp.]